MSGGPKPFRFRLERILHLRRSEMRAAETRLRLSENEATRLAGVAARDRGIAREVRAGMAQALSHSESASKHVGRVTRHEALVGHSQRSDAAARGASRHARDERAGWVAAQQKVRGLERLRARIRERFEREEERSGQDALDEIAGQSRQHGRLGRLARLGRWGLGIVIAFAVSAPVGGAEAPRDGAASSALSADRLLLEIRDRQAEFDRRERELEAREMTVGELEARVASRIEELKELRAELTKGLSSLDEESDLRVRQLAKMYASMPPDRAAPLLEDIDRDLATAVLRRMKPKKSAALMAKLSKPAALSLSRRVALPLVREEKSP